MSVVPSTKERSQDLVPVNPFSMVPEGASGLREFLNTLWRQKALFAGTVVVIVALAAGIVFSLTPKYTAAAHVLIAPRETHLAGIEAVLSSLSPDDPSVLSEVRVLQSRMLAAEVATKLSLDRSPEFNAALQPPSVLSTWTNMLKLRVNAWLGWFEQDTLSDADRKELERVAVVDAFLENLEVSQDGRSRVIRVAFSSEGRKTAAAVANALTRKYINAQLAAKIEATQHAKKWLTVGLEDLRENMVVSERAAEQYRAEIDSIRGKDVTLVSQGVSELGTELVLAQVKRAEADARLKQVEALDSFSISSATEVLDSPLIQKLREQQAELEREATVLTQRHGDRHPDIIAIQAERANLQARIDGESAKIARGLRNEVAIARSREAALSSRLSNSKDEAGALSKAEVQLHALETEAAANRSLYEVFLARAKETSIQEPFQQPDAQIISRADIPTEPSYPKKRLLLLVSFLVALLCAVLVVFAIESLDRGIRSADQLAGFTGARPLGLVPNITRRQRRISRPEDYLLTNPRSAFAEAIRNLYVGLTMRMRRGDYARATNKFKTNKRSYTVLVTSALPEEGKTVIAVSLARILANAGHKVVVVDADLRRPSVHKRVMVAQKPGLAEFLSGHVSLEKALHKDSKSEAAIVPAGEPYSEGILSFAALNNSMKALLKELGGEFEIVILDSPPLMRVADARLLAELVDETVFVVRWGTTRRETAISNLQQLRETGAIVSGVIVSLVDVRKHALYNFGDSGYYDMGRERYYEG